MGIVRVSGLFTLVFRGCSITKKQIRFVARLPKRKGTATQSESYLVEFPSLNLQVIYNVHYLHISSFACNYQFHDKVVICMYLKECYIFLLLYHLCINTVSERTVKDYMIGRHCQDQTRQFTIATTEEVQKVDTLFLFIPIYYPKEFQTPFQLPVLLFFEMEIAPLRHVAKSKNLGGRVVMRRAATAKIWGGVCPPPLPPRILHA